MFRTRVFTRVASRTERERERERVLRTGRTGRRRAVRARGTSAWPRSRWAPRRAARASARSRSRRASRRPSGSPARSRASRRGGRSARTQRTRWAPLSPEPLKPKRGFGRACTVQCSTGKLITVYYSSIHMRFWRIERSKLTRTHNRTAVCNAQWAQWHTWAHKMTKLSRFGDSGYSSLDCTRTIVQV